MCLVLLLFLRFPLFAFPGRLSLRTAQVRYGTVSCDVYIVPKSEDDYGIDIIYNIIGLQYSQRQQQQQARHERCGCE